MGRRNSASTNEAATQPSPRSPCPSAPTAPSGEEDGLSRRLMVTICAALGRVGIGLLVIADIPPADADPPDPHAAGRCPARLRFPLRWMVPVRAAPASSRGPAVGCGHRGAARRICGSPGTELRRISMPNSSNVRRRRFLGLTLGGNNCPARPSGKKGFLFSQGRKTAQLPPISASAPTMA